MATIPPVRRIGKEDFPEDVRQWVDKLLQPINEFMNAVSASYKNSFTLQDNLACQIKTIDIEPSTGLPFRFKSTISSVIGLVVLRAYIVGSRTTPIANALYADWDTDGDQILIRNVTGLTRGTKYTVTFLTFGGGPSSNQPQAQTQPSQSKTVPPSIWTTLTPLQNSWVAYGNGESNPQYLTTNSGMVVVDGVVKSGTYGTAVVVATLPAGARPATNKWFAASTATMPAQVLIKPTGDIIAYSGTDATRLSLNFTFKAER